MKYTDFIFLPEGLFLGVSQCFLQYLNVGPLFLQGRILSMQLHILTLFARQ